MREVSTDREPTRHIRWHDEVELRATLHSRDRYPRDEIEFGRLDRWDRDRASAPRPIRRPGRAARWVRLGLLLAAAAVLGVLIGWFGVPAVPR